MRGDSWLVIIAALFGVLGVVAGGLVSFLAQLAMLRREERTRTRMAARVIQQQLVVLTSELALEQLDSAARMDGTRLLDDWETYRDDLTRLPLSAWYALVKVMATLDVATQLGDLDEERRPLLSEAPTLAKGIAAAMDALEPEIADERRAWSRLGKRTSSPPPGQRRDEDEQAVPE